MELLCPPGPSGLYLHPTPYPSPPSILSLLPSRLGISFAYYGVILASAELLERDLVCGSRSESETESKPVVTALGDSEETRSPCYCHMFAPSDYRTMIISTVGEIARNVSALEQGR